MTTRTHWRRALAARHAAHVAEMQGDRSRAERCRKIDRRATLRAVGGRASFDAMCDGIRAELRAEGGAK